MDWFASRLLDWYDQHGRRDLPWQQEVSPYRVWVSEIMLQQTQVSTVIDYYQRFMARFATVQQLAAAPLDEVLHIWTGLGYYARARNLHKCANIICNDHDGIFPATQSALEELPGIGRSTAGAILALAMGQRASILDGNVKRVLTRFHAIPGYPGESGVSNTLWQMAEQHTPAQRTGAYTQAIMDLGATLCTRRSPSCAICPLAARCKALAAGEPERYPERKPARQKPVRQARFFIITQPNGMTLLEQRPLEGLWGGLFTPPQRAADHRAQDMLAELGLSDADVQHQRHAPGFRHSFTHFHLDIEPVYLQLARVPEVIDDSAKHRWVDPQALDRDNQAIGLSAPAVRMLASVGKVFAH